VDDDDDGDDDGDDDCCCLPVDLLYRYIVVCATYCVACPMHPHGSLQFNRNENVLHCIRFMQFFGNWNQGIPPLNSLPPRLQYLSPLFTLRIASTLIGIIDFDNRRQHRRTEPPPTARRFCLTVCLFDLSACVFFFLRPSPVLLLLLHFFSSIPCASGNTTCQNCICMCTCVCVNVCLTLFDIWFSIHLRLAASVHFLTSMFIFNDLRFSGNLRKNM